MKVRRDVVAARSVLRRARRGVAVGIRGMSDGREGRGDGRYDATMGFATPH